MKLPSFLLLAAIIIPPAFGQSYTISTAAGAGVPQNVPGKTTSFGSSVPSAIAADSAGNVFFADQNSIVRLDAITNTLSMVVGNGTTGYSGDNGPATSAQLNNPGGLALDPAGNIYIADSGNNVIRKVSHGVITTLAGNGTAGNPCANGPAASTGVNGATWLAVDSAGNVYVSEPANNCVLKVSNGQITSAAGTGKSGYTGDSNLAVNATLHKPAGVAVDSGGNLYIADSSNGVVREVTIVNGIIHTFAGDGSCCVFSGDNGEAINAELNFPTGLAVDSSGNLYIVDSLNYRIREVSSGIITTVAGGGKAVPGDGGPAISASLGSPSSVAVDSASDIYIGDPGSASIREVAHGTISTIAGNGSNGDNGPATSAQLGTSVDALVLDTAGNLYISASLDIREVSRAAGTITTFLGLGEVAKAVGNESCYAQATRGLAFNSAGNLFVSYSEFCRIFEVSGGMLSIFAGTGAQEQNQNGGPALEIAMSPQGLAIDSAGNTYFADAVFTGSFVYDGILPNLSPSIRKISNGIVTNLLSNAGSELTAPGGVVLDPAGNLYIADFGGNRILKYSTQSGVVTTVAGNGHAGFAGDNLGAASAELNGPLAVALDAAGNLYIADSRNNRIRKVDAINSIITTIAGNGTAGFAGDYGPAGNAELNFPSAVAVDTSGNAELNFPSAVAVDTSGDVFIADDNNVRVRVLTPSGGGSCSYFVSPSLLEPPPSGAVVTLNVQTTAFCPWTVSNLPSWITVSGASAGTGPGSASLSIAANTAAGRAAAISVGGFSVPISQQGTNTTPLIALVNNAEGGSQVIAPNTWVSILGSDLALPADSRTWQGTDFVNNQLPTKLDGVSVTVNGNPAYVYFISSTQINILTSPDAVSGSAQVQVTNNGVVSGMFNAQAQAASPSFFVFGAGPYVAATHADGSLVGPTTLYPGSTTPAQPGETVLIYANGFGMTSVPVVSGALTQSGTLSPLPGLTIGGVPAMVAFAGLNQTPGEFQFNVVIPSTIANGDQTIVATYNGMATQAGTLITVQR